jgi:DNA invertase Pin-like site-specific DNA recombinase
LSDDDAALWAAWEAGTALPAHPRLSDVAVRFAFYGRCSTEDNQDPETSRQWQIRAARNLLGIACPQGEIVASFFDVGHSRSLPWRRRPESARLLDELEDPARGWTGIIVGEGKRCFYGGQFNDVAPVFQHHSVSLWIPELSGAYDPTNASHYMMMSVNGGMSRGERQTVQTRVKLGMAAQVETQGRYQGGRPPYGYQAIGVAPHPNPRKAAEGFQLKKLVPDQARAPVVQRIFADFLAGKSMRQIATTLNTEGVPCPSAADPRRNPHRSANGWQVTTISTILANGRYTGYEFWGRFAKTETLLDPRDPSLGNTTKLTRSAEPLVRSREQTHEPLVSVADFIAAQEVGKSKAGRGGVPLPRTEKHRDTTASYPLKGRIRCSVCNRRMEVERYNRRNDDERALRYVRYRCRLRGIVPGSKAAEEHPLNIRVGQAAILSALANELARLFSPEHIDATVKTMIAAESGPTLEYARIRTARQRLSEAETRLGRLYDSIESGVDPAMIASRIEALQAEVVGLRAQVGLSRPKTAGLPPAEKICGYLAEIGSDFHRIFGPEADPAKLAAFFDAVNLAAVYDDAERRLHAECAIPIPTSENGSSRPGLPQGGGAVRVRGGTWTLPPLRRIWTFAA